MELFVYKRFEIRFDIGAGVDDAFMLCILRKKLSFRASDYSCTLY